MRETVLKDSVGLGVDKDRAIHVKQQVHAFSGPAHVVRAELRNHLLAAQHEGAVESRAGRLNQVDHHLLHNEARSRAAATIKRHVLGADAKDGRLAAPRSEARGSRRRQIEMAAVLEAQRQCAVFGSDLGWDEVYRR